MTLGGSEWPAGCLTYPVAAGVDAGGKDRDGRTALELVDETQETQLELLVLLRMEMERLEHDQGGAVWLAMQESEKSNQ